MKRILAIILAVALCGSAMAKELKWVDGTSLNICGHTIRNAKNPYSRLATKPYGFTNKAIIRYSQYSTGMYVMFKTNSSQVSAEWSVAAAKIRDNMTPIVQLGLDLYVKHNGKKMQRIHLEGDIPSPANPPSGCRFHTRCPYATEICSQQVPEYKEYGNGHFAACHLCEKELIKDEQ